ncbi:MAG: hypothetical protein ACYDDB_07255 [bacterium]
MKKTSSFIFLVFFFLLLSITLFQKKSRAIPPFAEKYHFACAVCHTVFPNLNPFGRAFWRNGFRLPNTTGTAADATQITEGLSLPNPWPVPFSVATWIQFTHAANENILPQNVGMVMSPDNNTDNFTVASMIDTGGTFKLNNPFTDSLSYFVMNNIGTGVPFTNAQTWASLNDIGYGFGVKPHLLNLKIGEPNTAGPYFYRQMPMFLPTYSDMNAQGLNVGFGGEGGHLINRPNPGVELYGTPGYNLWYKFTVTNDQGASSSGMNMSGMPSSSPVTSNAMAYSYSLKEYLPLNEGQLEFGYYGAFVSEPVSGQPNWVLMGNGMSYQGVSTVWQNPVRVDGLDIDYAFPGYMSEIGLTAMHQEDFHPYGNPSFPSQQLCLPQNNTSNYMTMMNGKNMPGFLGDNAGGTCSAGYTSYGNTNSSNGYSAIDVYGMASFMNNMYTGLMLMAEYSVYRWDNKALQEAYNFDYNSMSATRYSYNSANMLENYGSGLYQSGSYANNSGIMNEGVDWALTLSATYNIAYNAYFYAVYLLTDQPENNMFGTGIAFAF